MILIGQYDSPFVRRVGIALTLYGLPFQHRPWSIFADADKIRPYNPLVRVPTLVLDDGEVLIESHNILDYLDSLVPADRRLYPLTEPARRRALKIAALATGLADKAVSLFYETRLHREVSDIWVNRCRSQIAGVLAALEADRAGRVGEYWFGDRVGHADIAVAAALSFLSEVHPSLASMDKYPALGAHVARLEALRRCRHFLRSASRLSHPPDRTARSRPHRHQTVAAKLTYKIRRGRVVNAALRVGEAFYPSHAVHPAL